MQEHPNEMNSHETFSEAMSLALDGLLDGERLDAFEQHMNTCDPCRTQWLKWQRISDVLWIEPFAGPAQGFALRVDGLVQRQQRSRERMLGGLVLVGGTLSIWAVMAVSAVVAVVVWLSATPDVRQELTQYLGFGSQLVAVVAANLATVRDLVLSALPSPAAMLMSLCALAALLAVWAWLVLGDSGRRPAIATGDSRGSRQ